MAEQARALPAAPAETWLSFEELCDATGWARAWAYEQCANGNVKSRPSGSHGRNNKPRREYLLSSLPAAAQIRWADLQAEKALAVAAAPVAPTPQAELAFPAGDVPEGASDQARTRLAVVKQILEYRDRPKAFPIGGGRVIQGLNDFVVWIASQQQPAVSGRTVYRWLDRFEAAIKKGLNPYAELADRPRSDRNVSKVFTAHPAAAAFVQNKYIVERLRNVRLVHEALVREWPKLSIKGEPPSYATVRAYIDNQISEPMRTMAHVGPDAWDKLHALHLVRKRPEPMGWWVLDHRILDVDCRNTIFPTLKRDEMFRLHFTGVVDWGSMSWVGYCLAPQASSRTIGSALRMAFSDCGLPANLYWDNGEDFKAMQRAIEGAAEFSDLLETFLQGNKIGITRALPYNARAKMIEAMFNGLGQRFDQIWGAAYQGNAPHKRSEYNEAAQKRHTKYLAGKTDSTVLPTDKEVIAGLMQWMVRENNRPRKALEGAKPAELLEAAVKKNDRPPVARRLLDMLFCERDHRTVGQGGTVRLDNRIYEPGEGYLLALSEREREKIVVLRDPYCLEEATAIEPETGAFIGELRLQEFVPQSTGGHLSRDVIAAHRRKVLGAKRFYVGNIAVLAALSSGQGWKTEREVLLEEAGVAISPAVAAAAPGSRSLPPAPARPVLDSPFVDDAAARCIAAFGAEEGAD